MKLLQVIITAQQLIASPGQLKGPIRRVHRFHACSIRFFFFIGAIVLQGDISFRKRFIKNGFRETSYGYLINLRLSCLSKKP